MSASPEKYITTYMRHWRQTHRELDRAQKKALRRRPTGQYSSLKEAAKKRGLEVELTFDQFLEIRSGNCTYCNGPLPESCGGLDRIDNDKGYLLDNIVACCRRCNLSKHSMNQIEFREWVTKVYTSWVNKETN